MDERGRGVAAQGAFGPKLIIALLILLPTCWTLSGAAPETNWSPLGDALTAENAGLFVGVNDYPKETILPLKFSVNDAVAQAEMFVMRLKLIPAQRCHLLLAGSPTARYAPRLKALQDAGAVVVPSAGRATILFHLETVRRLSSGSNSLLIVSFSGHGNEYRETPYFIPSDGLAGIPSSFLSLTTDVANNLATTGRQKRLLFIDACRLDFAPGQKGNYRLPEVTAAFRQAFAETRGLVTLASCGAGQASLEDPRSESGVFTGKLLTALEEGIGAVDSEFITLGQVSAYLKIAVPKRAAELAADDHRIAEAQIQHVWHQGTLDALEVPLAISPHVDVARRRLKERKLRAAKLLHEAAGANSSQLTPSVVAAVESAIQLISAPHPGGLLDKIEISLSRSGPRDPAGFLAWWNEERRQQTVGPIASKGTLDGPIGEAKAPPPRPLTRPKPLVLVAPLAGIPAGSAEATQARFEEALRLPGNVELRSITPQIAGRPLDTATAEGLLREHQATTLVLGSFGETVEGNEKATAGRRVSSQRYWEVPLTVTVVSLEEGRIASRRKAFTGEARRPSGSSDGGGASEAIADAIVRLSDDGGKFLNLK